MSYFAVQLKGRGFAVPVELPEGGNVAAAGFFVSVFVEATNEDEACEMAVDIFLQSDVFTSTPRRKS